jgi:hypothetical protein
MTNKRHTSIMVNKLKNAAFIFSILPIIGDPLTSKALKPAPSLLNMRL